MLKRFNIVLNYIIIKHSLLLTQTVDQINTCAKDLYQLTENSAPFDWSESCQHSFELLKIALSSTSVLSNPIPGKTFVLDTDASNAGIGAVLSQHDGNAESCCLVQQNFVETGAQLLCHQT